MGGATGWRQIQDGGDWMREMEKRVLHEERRPNIRAAADIMGPGIAPYSVLINDWSADETAFNGFFHTVPGALNTPDPTRYWMGTSQATSDGYGLERVTEWQGTTAEIVWPRLTYVRRFWSATPGAVRQYSAWRLDDGVPPGIITEYGGSSVAPANWNTVSDAAAWTPAAGWSITRQETRRVADNFIWVDVEGLRTGAPITIPASGDASNTLVATLSTDYTLTAGQNALTSGQTGRAAHYNCYSNRQCSITSFGGTTSYATSEDYSFGGPLPVTAIAQPAPTVATPNGWFYCNGSVRNRADYPDLFAVIGTRWNTGGESGTQFRLPNLPGKVIRA